MEKLLMRKSIKSTFFSGILMLSSSLFPMHQEQTIDSYLHLLPDELNNQIACYTLCGNNPEVYADCMCKVLKGHTALITSVCCTNDKIITASVDKTARIWDLKTGTLLHTLQGHTDRITSVCCTDDKIITASDDTTARIWDLKTGTLLHTLQGHTDWIRSVCFT